MSDPKIVASAKAQSRQPPKAVDSSQAWAVLGWIGLAFLLVGGSDFALVWFPLRIGTREWEFATVTQSFNGLPILLLGVGLLVVAAERLERRWWWVVGLVAATVMLLWVLLGVVLWSMNASLALQTAPENLAQGVQKAVAKTLIQSLVYTAAFAYLIVRAWKAGGGAKRPAEA